MTTLAKLLLVFCRRPKSVGTHGNEALAERLRAAASGIRHDFPCHDSELLDNAADQLDLLAPRHDISSTNRPRD